MAGAAWAEFEKLAYEIQRDLAGSADVRLGDTIQGVDSNIPRQIDISIRQQVGQYSVLIVVDCKDHRAPLDVNIVGEFVTLVRDVRANKGALIASRGFTEAALALARTHGIDTFTLIDTANTKWQTYVTFPALLHRLYIVSGSFRFSEAGAAAMRWPEGDPRLWNIYGPDQASLGLLGDILATKWNGHELPEEPGRHEVVLVEHARFASDAVDELTVSASIVVAEAYYFGPWPIQTRGLQNVQTGGLVTREFRTDPLSPYEIEQGRVPGWRKIDNPNTLAVRPAISLGYSDVLPVSGDYA